MSVRIEGMPRLHAKLTKLTGEAERTTQREVKRAALNVQRGAKRHLSEKVYAQSETPGYVRTGRLMNSIAHEIDDGGMNATIGTNVEYAPYVELGTRRTRPKPYLFPALEEERGPFLRRLKRELGADFVRTSR